MADPTGPTLADVADWLARGRAPTRFHARTVLLTLGEALLEGRETVAGAGLATARAWIEGAPQAWGEAIASELSMAVTEHVRSADPRWIEHPRYDLAYAVEARHRLEARLACAAALGVDVAEELLAAIARADALLAPRLGPGGAGGNEKA